MRRGQRYRLMRAIADHIAADDPTFHEIDIQLRAFGVATPHSSDAFGSSRRTYVLGTLTDATEDSLLELADDCGVDTTGVVLSRQVPPKIWPDTSTFRLFISHLAEHKDKASRLRDCLAPHYISGFVAHTDIKPTLLWQIEIERALQTMDAFIAIHTPGFASSSWTQQEIGFAVARGVKIISLKMDEDPTGFIGQLQALPRSGRNAEQIAKDVRDILAMDELTRQRITEVEARHRLQPEVKDEEIPF